MIVDNEKHMIVDNKKHMIIDSKKLMIVDDCHWKTSTRAGSFLTFIGTSNA